MRWQLDVCWLSPEEFIKIAEDFELALMILVLGIHRYHIYLNCRLMSLKLTVFFVSGSEYSHVILEAIIALGRALDLKIVAEGVETKLQCDTLSNSGCDLLHGFYLARPMPQNESENQFLSFQSA